MKNGWCENMFGTLVHYVNDKHHNENGSTRIYYNGSKYWMKNNSYHRIDGPALELIPKDKQWYFKGIKFKCKCQNDFELLIKMTPYLPRKRKIQKILTINLSLKKYSAPIQ